MKTFLLLATATVLATGWFALAGSARPEDPVTVDYTFRTAPLHSQGVKTMDELRGKPVVVDFWGKN